MKQINFLVCTLLLWASVSYAGFAQLNDFSFLRIDNYQDGFTKLKLGNNPASFWTGVDITASGHTHLSMTFRIPEGSPDYTKLQIRPNGSSDSPLSLAPYLPGGFSTGLEWYTIHIPLSDFAGSIDFTNLYLIQVPYSADAGRFTFDLKSITFTGGGQPYVWYGYGKRDNIQDGDGNVGQMAAFTQSDLYMNPHITLPAGTPATGRVELRAIYKDQYDQSQFNALWHWDDGYTGSTRTGLQAGSYEVIFGPVDGAYDTLQFSLMAKENVVAQKDFTEPTETEDGQLKVLARGWTPAFRDIVEDTLIIGTADAEVLDTFRSHHISFALRVKPLFIGQDAALNSYYLTLPENYASGRTLVVYDKDHQEIRRQHLPYIFKFHEGYVDDLGRVFIFSRTTNTELLIGGKRYRTDNESHVLAMYEPDGQVGWVRFLDEFKNGHTSNFVDDQLERFIWSYRKAESNGVHTVLAALGMNGNTIKVVRSSLPLGGTSSFDAQHGRYDHLVVEGNDIYLMTLQDAGATFASPNPIGVTASYLYRFDEDLNTVWVQKQDELYLGNSTFNGDQNPQYLDHKPIFIYATYYSNGYTVNSYKMTYKDTDGNDKWVYSLAGSVYNKREHFGEDLMVWPTRRYNGYSYQGEYYAPYDVVNYDFDTLYTIFVPYSQYLGAGHVDRENNLHVEYVIEEVEDNVNYWDYYADVIHVSYSPVIRTTLPIPAGTTSFSYAIGDSVGHTFSFTYDKPAASSMRLLAEGLSPTESILYPNPSNERATFRYNNALEHNSLTLYDLSGQVLKTWADVPATGIEISRGNLQDGVYILIYEDQDQAITERLIFR